MSKFGNTLTSDGWDNASAQHIFSLVDLQPQGATLADYIDTTGVLSIDALYTFEAMKAHILKRGPHQGTLDLSQYYGFLCTDSPSVNRAMWKMIEDWFPLMCALPCQMHQWSLAIAAIFAIKWVAERWLRCHLGIKKFKNVKFLRERLQVKQETICVKQYPHGPRRYIKNAKTRAGTKFIAMERWIDNVPAAVQTVQDPDFIDKYEKKVVFKRKASESEEDSEAETETEDAAAADAEGEPPANRRKSLSAELALVKASVKDDKLVADCKAIIDVITPVYKLMRYGDSHSLMAGEWYPQSS